jgi:hypothetical protein
MRHVVTIRRTDRPDDPGIARREATCNGCPWRAAVTTGYDNADLLAAHAAMLHETASLVAPLTETENLA